MAHPRRIAFSAATPPSDRAMWCGFIPTQTSSDLSLAVHTWQLTDLWVVCLFPVRKVLRCFSRRIGRLSRGSFYDGI
jgi:hypothetical protein